MNERVREREREGKKFSRMSNDKEARLEIIRSVTDPSSRIALVYQSFCCRTIADRLNYDWIAEKNPDGNSAPLLHPVSC